MERFLPLIDQDPELLVLQLSDPSIGYIDMKRFCDVSRKARALCTTDPRFVELLRKKKESLLMPLQYPDLNQMCETHKELQDVCEDNDFWARKITRDFWNEEKMGWNALISRDINREMRKRGWPRKEISWKEMYGFVLDSVLPKWLRFYITTNNIDVVRRLVEVGLDINAPRRIFDRRRHYNEYPIITAARTASNRNDTAILRYLLEQGASTEPFGDLSTLCRRFQGPTCGEIRDLIAAYS